MRKTSLECALLYAAASVAALFFLSLPVFGRTGGLLVTLGICLLIPGLLVLGTIAAALGVPKHPRFLSHIVAAFGIAAGGLVLGITLDGYGRGLIFSMNYSRYRQYVQEAFRHPPAKPETGEQAVLPDLKAIGTEGAYYVYPKEKPYIEIRTETDGLSYEAILVCQTPLWSTVKTGRLLLVKNDDLGYWYFRRR